jgi:hypothetical protein
MKSRRALWGYNPKAYVQLIQSVRNEFDLARKKLEEELSALSHTNITLEEELEARKQELAEQGVMEKELKELLRQNQVSVSEDRGEPSSQANRQHAN